MSDTGVCRHRCRSRSFRTSSVLCCPPPSRRYLALLMIVLRLRAELCNIQTCAVTGHTEQTHRKKQVEVAVGMSNTKVLLRDTVCVMQGKRGGEVPSAALRKRSALSQIGAPVHPCRESGRWLCHPSSRSTRQIINFLVAL